MTAEVQGFFGFIFSSGRLRRERACVRVLPREGGAWGAGWTVGVPRTLSGRRLRVLDGYVGVGRLTLAASVVVVFLFLLSSVFLSFLCYFWKNQQTVSLLSFLSAVSLLENVLSIRLTVPEMTGTVSVLMYLSEQGASRIALASVRQGLDSGLSSSCGRVWVFFSTLC